jgi:hypothetical protein
MDLLIKKIGVFAIFIAVCCIICPIEYFILQQIFGSIFFYVGFPIYILICLSQGWVFGTIIGYAFLELDRLDDEEQSDSD